MSFADCIAEIQASAGRELSDEELDRIASRLDREIRGAKAERKADDIGEVLRRAARDEADQVELERRAAQRNAALNIIRRQEIDAFLNQFPDAAEGLQALLVGVVRGTPGARRSIDARGKAIETEWLGAMLSDLRKGDLIPLARSGALDELIAREMWELREGGNPGVTRNDAAKRIADIFARYKEEAPAQAEPRRGHDRQARRAYRPSP